MNAVVVLFTVLCAFATVFSRKTVTASFFFLLCCCGVCACLFQMNLIPLALILLFSSSFWLMVYFLFSTLLSEEINAKSTFNKKNRLIFGITTLIAYLFIVVIYLGEIIEKAPLAATKNDLLEYWKTDFIQNFPILLTYLLILVSTLMMVLYMTWNPNGQNPKELHHDTF